MKNIVHAFVIALTLTGSAAYTQMHMSQAKTLTAKTSSVPQPMCMPNDPSACGMR